MAPIVADFGSLASVSWQVRSLILVILIPSAYIFYQRVYSPLAKIPGPFWASLTHIWMAKQSNDGQFHRTAISLHEKHGDLVRLTPTEVSVADLELVKKIFGAGNRFDKAGFYDTWKGNRKFDLFGERDSKVHGSMRRLVSRPYSMDSLRDLETYAESTMKSFISHLHQMESKTVDMGTWFQLFAFDTIGELSFSHPFGFMDMGEDDGTLRAIAGALGSLAWVAFVPWVAKINKIITPIFGNQLAAQARNGKFAAFAAREIETRKDRSENHRDILTKLLETRATKPELDDTAVLGVLNSNVFAGSDTTAIALRAVFYFLLKTPSVLGRFMAELDQRRKDGELSELVTFQEAERWPYLQAIIYEALRLHTPPGNSFPRVVPAPGVEVAGHYLPAGSEVSVNAWVIHRKKDIFGEDVEVFRPERWLDESRKGDMLRYFLAFGGGSRTCIGRNISWMEISKLIPTLFLNFTFRLTDPNKPLEETCWSLVFQKGLNVTFRSRERGETY